LNESYVSLDSGNGITRDLTKHPTINQQNINNVCLFTCVAHICLMNSVGNFFENQDE